MDASAVNGIIKIAITGFGTIGPRHADAVLKNDDLKLVAVVDPVSGPASLALKHGANFNNSLEELLASPHKPDAAIICTPNHMHAAAANLLSSAGDHILIEKPLCPDTETGKELVVHLKETNACLGTKALVGHHSKFNPYAVATAETIASGSLGNIIGVNGLWTLLKPMRYFDLEWRRTKDAGPVLINLIHDVNLLHFFFGPIVREQADKTISQRGFEVEEGVAIIFRFASGILGILMKGPSGPLFKICFSP